GLLPAVVLFPHDVAIDARLGIAAQVRKAFSIADGEGPRAQGDAGQDAQDKRGHAQAAASHPLPHGQFSTPQSARKLEAIVTTLLGKRHWSLCGGSHIALEPASRRYERAQQFLQVNYGDACSHIAGRVWEYQLALMNHSSARVHDIRNIAEPLGSGRNEQ